MYMKRVKYILKRLKSFKWTNWFKIVGVIAKKTKKPRIVIFIDTVYCMLKYGSGYMDYFEFEFYLLTKEERKTYLTSSINNQIIAKYNNKSDMKVFHDKLLFNERFKQYLKREYLDLSKSSFKDFCKFISNKSKIVAKVVDECGGKGVDIYNLKDYKDKETLFNILKENKQYLLEDYIEQNDKMNKLYSGSINSLRIITFVKDDGSVVILNTVLRIGNGGVVDNFSSGGMYTFVSDTGKVLVPAIDEKGHIYKTHPISNTKIEGFIIPDFNEVISYVKSLAKVVPSVRYVGWDIALTKNGVDVIEGNEYSGVFQIKPSLSKDHTGLLPKYKKYMDL